MGFCFSCCRRHPKSKQADADIDVERQPLLRSDTEALKLKHPETRTPYEKIADVLAALHAGKLPSQQQLDDALRKLLSSGLLEVEDGNDDELDENARKVVQDAREVVEAFMQVGLEKNDDNRVQDLVYQLQELSSQAQIIPVDVKAPPEVHINDGSAERLQTAASAIPSQNELASDTVALISSLRTLATLLLTSSAFRLIIGDLLAAARQLVADSAARVRKAAEAVEQVSEAVEVNVRPGSEASPSIQPIAVTSAQEEAQTNPAPDNRETKSSKEVVLERIEDIFRRAQASPQYNSALRTLLYIFRKYAERVSLASTAISDAADAPPGESSSVQISAPIIVPDPRFTRILEDLRIILERFAGGKSLGPLLQILFKTVQDISAVSANGGNRDVQTFFAKVGKWLDEALADPSFVTSKLGRDAASRLYDEAYTLLSQDTQLSRNIESLMEEANAFADAIKSDRSTNKLFTALDILHSDTLTLLGRTKESGKQAATHWRTTLLRTVLGWVVPRLLRAIRVLPMPRFEYVSSLSDGTKIEAAIDALLLSAEESLVPDVLSVQEFAEVRVEVDESVGAAELINPNARLLSAREDFDTDAARGQERGDLENGLRALLNHEDESYGSITSPRSRKRKKSNLTTTSRMRIHVEGLRLGAHDVGYYASYSRNSWLGYTDEGLLSVEIGRGRHRRGEGLAADVGLELESGFEREDKKDVGRGRGRGQSRIGDSVADERLFRVLDVRTAIPGLALHISHSRHWILNPLLAPLVGPIGRTVGPRVLNAQIRAALETVERVLREVKKKADEKAEDRHREKGKEPSEETQTQTGASDWWDAFLERFGSREDQEEEEVTGEDSEEQEEQEVCTETHTSPHLTGLVRTTIQEPEPSPGQDPANPPSENSLAIGLGAQLLPGKAEPAALGVPVARESPGEAVQEVTRAGREALEDVQGKVQDVKEGVESVGRRGIEETVKVRKVVEEAEERMGRQERREKKRRGWKSRAFDW